MAIHRPESVKKVSVSQETAPFIISVNPVTKLSWGKSLPESSLVVTHLFFILNEDLLVCLQGKPESVAFQFRGGESKAGSDLPESWWGIGMDCSPPGSGMNHKTAVAGMMPAQPVVIPAVTLLSLQPAGIPRAPV